MFIYMDSIIFLYEIYLLTLLHKNTLTGYGGANKDKVGLFEKMMLTSPIVPVSDAAYALALAMTHAQILRTQRTTKKEVTL